jgi:hypothetical protein
VLIGRDPASVVDDRYGMVDVQRDVHLVAVSGERFVYRVVDDLVDQVMEPRGAGGADVHRGALADRFEAFEDLDFVRTVIVGRATAVAVAACRGVVRRRHAIGRCGRPLRDPG